MRSFPSGFLWGTATAAYQVEGHNFNCDWWDWEQVPGHVHDGHSARVACDWWGGRYREDFDRARALGNNAHRMSLEWSRIEPRAGEWDESALETYRDMLVALRERGMEPMVTLVHFTQPRWFMQGGGWVNSAAPERFERYAAYVVNRLGDLCHLWLTLNESNLYLLLNYVWTLRPPGAGNLVHAFRVGRHMMLAHERAYRAIHLFQPHAQVSLAHQWRWLTPANPRSPLDRIATRMGNYLTNEIFVRALTRGVLSFPIGWGEKFGAGKCSIDYLALNYYFEDRVAFDITRPGSLFARNLPVTWLTGTPYETLETVGNINPDAFYRLVMSLATLKLPIYITENGVFDIGQDNQSRYLVAHVAALQRALTEGADVRGYFWWTLTDNFEWDAGYWLKFGLYCLDVASQTRTKRPAADTYQEIIRENGISDELLERYGREK